MTNVIVVDGQSVKVHDGTKIFLRELKGISKTFSQLRVAYFGEERAKEKATTSFYNQLTRDVEKGIIVKTANGYELSELGKKALTYCEENNVDLNIKSEAQRRFETNKKA